jgi:PAS domain S-box-containing protein
MNGTVLFLGTRMADLAVMAEAFAGPYSARGIRVLSGCRAGGTLHPLTAALLAEVGVSVEEFQPVTGEALPAVACDVVVHVGQAGEPRVRFLPGNPAEVEWNLEEPAADGDTETVRGALRAARDELGRLVADFFDRGAFAALLRVKRDTDLILNGLTDGIIAHDMERRVFYFNRAAERITGYSRDEVLNRCCQDVFPGGLCGGKCCLPDGELKLPEEGQKEVEIAMKSGERRRVAMTVQVIGDRGGTDRALLTSFRDLTREHELARRLGEIRHYAGIVGRDRKMLEIYDMIPDLAESTVPVLIQGESGTGKELIAAAIHSEGPRAARQFVTVNCGALPEGLLESELFGHVRGAFTGAVRDKKGRFELADGGTIFLDEIGDVSPAMQVKLLRVLQTGCFERVGGENTIQVDARVVSATNKDLSREIAAARFREDLYYRLSVVPIFVPPLRDRRADIPLLAEHTVRRIAKAAGRDDLALSPEALDLMMSYAWPGNVREMENWIQFALVKCKGSLILPEHLPPMALPAFGRGAAPAAPRGDYPPPRRRGQLDAESVRAALSQARGNRVEAAKILGISRATLYRFLQKDPSVAE